MECRCTGITTLEALRPFVFSPTDPVASLPNSVIPSQSQKDLAGILVALASRMPAVLLDLENIYLSKTTAINPQPWSMRWCLLTGSLCELALAKPSTDAAFWSALLGCVSAPQCAERVDIWGDGRRVDPSVVNADASGQVWAQWLTAGLLSGLLHQEIEACPLVIVDAVARLWSLPPQNAVDVQSITVCSYIGPAKKFLLGHANSLKHSVRFALAAVVAMTVAERDKNQVSTAWGENLKV
jgi:hypothetical protein